MGFRGVTYKTCLVPQEKLGTGWKSRVLRVHTNITLSKATQSSESHRVEDKSVFRRTLGIKTGKPGSLRRPKSKTQTSINSRGTGSLGAVRWLAVPWKLEWLGTDAWAGHRCLTHKVCYVKDRELRHAYMKCWFSFNIRTLSLDDFSFITRP